MSDQHSTPSPKEQADQVETLARRKDASMVGEFLYFLGTNKKWWLTPIIVILLLLGLLVVIGGSGAGPFIYTVF